jgi:PKD repeat protein
VRKILALTGALLISVAAFGGSTAFQPTTTLAQETGNNTNLTSSFTGTTNGDVQPGNISKVDIHTLLYAGRTTKVFAHYMPWWGGSGHVKIGLGDEANPTVVDAQVADAISRGIDGFIVDWYGPQSTHHNTATLNVKAAAEASTNFEFAICEDSGSLTGATDVTAKLLSDIQYMADNYFSSPRYLRWNGRPVVSFFLNTSLAINWATVRAQAAGNPVFIFRNSSGFTDTDSDGSFSWTNDSGNVNDMGLTTEDTFYNAGLVHPSLLTIGSAYKGFNDTIASWGSNRIKNQQCGQTWLAIWADVGKYYSATNQLSLLQIATWNDYEEGTEVESGIDNCVTISAALSGSTLGWTITGQESTIDHYTVFASQDGVNLMAVEQVAAGTHAADLSALGLPAGQYSFFVKAVGKPTLLNQMSGAVSYTLATPAVMLAVTPASGIAPVTVTASTSGSTCSGGTIQSTQIDFGDGTMVTAASASHAYNSAGTYTVTATATGSNGLTATAQQIVTVATNEPPVVALSVSPASGTAALLVTASTAGSTTPNGSIVSTSINFGDGTAVSGASASHTYSTAGTYTVTATVIDNIGAKGTAKTSVSVIAAATPVQSSGAGGNGSPDFTLTAPAQGVTLSSAGTGSSQIAITPENGFNSAVTLSCSGLPAGATCSFSPSTVTPISGMTSVSLTINIPVTVSRLTPAPKTKPLLAFTLPFFAIAAGSLAVGDKTKKKSAFWVVLVLVLALGAVSIGCGGNAGQTASASATAQNSTNIPASSGSGDSTSASHVYTIIVDASSGAIQHSTSVTVTVD